MLDTDAIGIAPVMGEWRPASDFLTLGHVPNTHVGKTLAWQGDHVVLHKRFSLHQVTTFRFIEQPIDGITDLGNNLQSIAEHGQDFFLLRDKLKPGTPLPCSRESIHFDDVGHRWMVVDIDGWAPPAHLSIRTPTHLHEIVDQAILTRVPHARGDEPQAETWRFEALACSPRAWG